MINNIILAGIEDEKIAKVKEVCLLALEITLGLSEEHKFIIAGTKDAKVQLKLKAKQSSTFLSIVTKEIEDANSTIVEPLKDLSNFIVYEDEESFLCQMDDIFPGLGILNVTDTIEEESIKDEVDDLILQEEAPILEEETTEVASGFIIPDYDIQGEEENTSASMISTLKAQIFNLQSQLATEDSGESEILRGNISELELKVSNLESELATITNEKKVITLTLEDKSKELDALLVKKEEDTEAEILLREVTKEKVELENKITELSTKLSEITLELTTTIEERNLLLQKSKEDNSKVDDINTSLDTLNLELEECLEELSDLREQYSELKVAYTKKEELFIKLKTAYQAIGKSIFNSLERKASPYSGKRDRVFDYVGKLENVITVVSGSAESTSDTSHYIKSMVNQIKGKVLVIDFCYDSVLDFYLDVDIKYNKTCVDYLEDKCTMPECFKMAKVGCMYGTLAKDYFNEFYLLKMDWLKLIELIKQNTERGTTVILNLGDVCNGVRGTVFNTLVQYTESYVVTKATTLNIRSMLRCMSSMEEPKKVSKQVLIQAEMGSLPVLSKTVSELFETLVVKENEL